MTDIEPLKLSGLILCLALILILGVSVSNIITNTNDNLLSAAESGNLKDVSQQLAYGADVNARSKNGVTPLHFAALLGHKDVAELLISRGANIEAKEKYGGTPLYFAAVMGHKNVAELLIAKGAKVETLHSAALLGQKDIAELLMSKGADVNAREKVRIQKIQTSQAARKEQELWQRAPSSVDAKAVPAYLDKHPSGSHVASALEKLAVLSKTEASGPKTEAIIRDCPECPEMVILPAGSFDMGLNEVDDEKPAHRVTIGKSFSMGKTEVTQGQWKAIMDNNPSHFANCGDNCPVEQVSWNDAQAFILKLNAKTGKQYRLPSEAEWEYACHAGVRQAYCGSDSADSVAWHDGNSGNSTHPAAEKQANAFGLYDMSGNVWEWVEDSYHADYNGAPLDGSAWQGDGESRVLRGGSWIVSPRVGRAASRNWNKPANSYYNLGFRIARTLP